MLLGVDVLGKDSIDKLLGAKSDKADQIGQNADEDAKVEDPEGRPVWDATPTPPYNHNPASEGGTRSFNRAFLFTDSGGTNATAPTVVPVAPVAPTLRGRLRAAIAMVTSDDSAEVFVTDGPIPSISLDERLPSDGRLVPLVPATQAIVSSTSSSEKIGQEQQEQEQDQWARKE